MSDHITAYIQSHPDEAATMIRQLAYGMSRGRCEISYNPVLVAALKMAADELERLKRAEDRSFWDDAMEIMNEMTNAQVEEALQFLNARRYRPPIGKCDGQ